MAEERISVLDGLPLWARLVCLVGFPVFVAIFYMAKDVGYLPSIAEQNAHALSTVIEQHKAILDETEVVAKGIKGLCRNSAKSQADLRECP